MPSLHNSPPPTTLSPTVPDHTTPSCYHAVTRIHGSAIIRPLALSNLQLHRLYHNRKRYPHSEFKLYDQFLRTHSSSIEWLLQRSDPSVRYRTLTDINALPSTHPDVIEAHSSVQGSALLKEILGHQLADGSWRGPRGDTWEEKGTVFSLLLLAELGADSSVATERALDHLHSHYQLPSGRIAYRPVRNPRSQETSSTWMWCITAAVLRAGALLGHLKSPAIQHAIEFFEDAHCNEGGWHCSTYSGDPSKVTPLNCYMGTMKALGAFSAIPPKRRSKKIRSIIDSEVQTCLDNEVCYYRVNREGQPAIKKAWLKFAFPRYWRADALEAVDILTSFGVRDSRMDRAVVIIREKMQSNGRWLMDFSETKRAWIKIEEEGMPSKWITLRALRVLKRLGPEKTDHQR